MNRLNDSFLIVNLSCWLGVFWLPILWLPANPPAASWLCPSTFVRCPLWSPRSFPALLFRWCSHCVRLYVWLFRPSLWSLFEFDIIQKKLFLLYLITEFYLRDHIKITGFVSLESQLFLKKEGLAIWKVVTGIQLPECLLLISWLGSFCVLV